MSKRQPKTTSSRKPAAKSTAPGARKLKSVPPKKAPVKKPAAKKPVTKKPPAKKVVAKKVPAKKPIVKKAPVKPATVKVAAKKTVAIKTKSPVRAKVPTKAKTSKTTQLKPKPAASTAKTPAKPPRETVATLRLHVDGLVKRLKTADTLTRKSVKSLETAYDALEKQVKDHRTVNHAALTRRVDQLSAQLTQTIESTKSEISADLKAALDNPTITGLQAAIGKSEMRLSHAEMMQSQALAKINRHIADLARVIDTRLKTNAKNIGTQNQKIIELEGRFSSIEAKTGERITNVENTTATAMRRLGDNLVSVTEQFQTKLDQQNAVLRDKVAGIGLETSKDFDHYKAETSRRIDKLDDGQKDQSEFMDRAIAKLASRIDNLEYGLSDLSQPAVPTAVAPPAAPAQPETDIENAFLMAEQGTSVTTQDIANAPAANPYIHIVPDAAPASQDYTQTADAFSPPPSAAPVAAGQPQPYQPEPPQPQMAQQHHYVDPAQAAYTAQLQAQTQAGQTHGNTAFAHEPYVQQQPAYTDAAAISQQPSSGPLEFVPPQDLRPEELPYADPGYGDGAQVEGMTRPGHVEGETQKLSKKKSKLKAGTALSKLPTLTPRNLRVAGLAVVLAAAGYFGLRSFTGSPQDNVATIDAPANNADIMPAAGSQDPITITTMEPIGDYQDNLGAQTTADLNDLPAALPASASSQTLEQAANSGNAIAQFQLGLYYLDAGRSNEGVQLIRASANQGQPAAQYRLAKLYEAGIGVKADPDMARQLTERAARAGNRIAMHDLGLYYADGLGGVERDITTALSWFEKAAERGVVDSQYNLGVLFETSPQVPRDAVTSLVWYSIAAGQGDQVAASRIPVLNKDLSAEQLEQAERRIAQFKPTAIDNDANGIFRNVAWTMPQAQTLKPATELVRDAQALLDQLGYEVGTPDGAMGPRTQAAVVAFEKASGLPETGSVSASLVEWLEAAAGA